MSVSKKSSKTKTRKSATGAGGGNLHKHFESERISDDIAAFEKAGGKVEKLGVTRVLQKIAPTNAGETAASAPKPTAAPRKR
ncbi:MAG: hypothetical protein ACREO4_00985 [Lysobacter sp.]